MRVLVVEDSLRLRETVAEAHRRTGYTVDTSPNGLDGYHKAVAGEYDVIILDLMLPGMEGMSFLRRLRSHGNSTGVLILTAKDALAARIEGLNGGADDYMVKPFDLNELIARVQAVGRRAHTRPSTVITVSDIAIDTAGRVVHRGGQPISLSAREYALLEFLALRKGSVVSREEIERRMYNGPHEIMSNAVDAAVYALRRKIDTPGGPSLIKTRRGLGYVLGEE